MRHWLCGNVILVVLVALAHDVYDSRLVVSGLFGAAPAEFPDAKPDDDACTAGSENPNKDKNDAKSFASFGVVVGLGIGIGTGRGGWLDIA